MKPEAAPDVGLLIDDLAGEYQTSLGASRIGARERLNAAHLVDVLEGAGAEPDRVRGVLRAALAKSRAEADVFDRVYARMLRGKQSATPESPTESTAGTSAAPDLDDIPKRSWKRLALWAGLAAAVVAVLAAVVLLWPKTEEVVGPAPGPRTSGSSSNATVETNVQAGSNSVGRGDALPADVMQIGDAAQRKLVEETLAIFEYAKEFGYRPSPRELASAMTMRLHRPEADLAHDIARDVGIAPDAPLDLFSIHTLASVHAALYGPSRAEAQDMAMATMVAGLAVQQTEYLTVEDGQLILHWLADDWRQQALEGEPIDDDVLEIIVSPDGSRALTRGVATSILWDLVGQKEIRRVETPGGNAEVSIPPEPRAVFIPGTNDAVVYGGNGTTYLAADGADPEWAPAAGIAQFVVSASGSGFAFQDGSDRLEVWRAGSQTEHGAFAPGATFTLIALSNNLDLVIGAVDSATELWSASGERLLTLPLPQEYGDAHFVANDTRILLNRGGNVELYDAQSGEVVTRFDEFLKGKQSAVGFPSNDGAKVFIQARDYVGKYITIMNASSGKSLSEPLDFASAVSGRTTPGAPDLLVFRGPFDPPGHKLAYLPVSDNEFKMVDNELDLPDTAVQYLNIPSMQEAAVRAQAFAATRQTKPLPDWPMWLMAIVPLAAAGVVLAHPAAWRRAYLSRRKIETDTLVRKLAANVTTFEPLAGERRAVGRLDQRVHRPSHRLDLRKTVLATARAGGLFTPVTDSDAGTPEYVALIERRRLSDADAARMVAFFSRLRAAGLSLTLYTYSGTPEALTPLRGGRAISIETLRQRHAGAFLFITGDAARFYSRRTNGAAPWTHRIGHIMRAGEGQSHAPTWSGAAFLSREPMPRLGPAERAIERDLGMVVRHTDAADLTEIGEYFHGRAASLAHHDDVGREPAPAYFAERPERLMDQEPPGVIERQDLAPQLEAWLGADGLRWVRSLAYYPIVQWDLALYLASIQFPHMTAEARTEMEARVARLPWLEHGYMPEWVRETLVKDADPKEEKRIVRDIVAVMAEAHEGADGNVSFQVIDEAQGVAGEHAGDAIFIDAVARAKARPWDLPPPSQWLRRAPKALQMPWARMRIALAGVVLAIAAALFTPHSGNMAPLAQWAPVIVFGLVAILMALGPMLLLRWTERREE